MTANRSDRRKQMIEAFDRQLPELLQAWEHGLRRGYSLRQLLAATARLDQSDPAPDSEAGIGAAQILASVPSMNPDPIAAEFREVHEAVEKGVSFLEAMDQMLDRIPSVRLTLLVATLEAQRREGSNLADLLQVLSVMMQMQIE